MLEPKQTKGMSLGMTLIEVMAVMVIIGVILTIAVPNFKSQIKKVNSATEEANLQLLQGAVQQFKLDTGAYPADLNYLVTNPATGIPGWAGPYVGGIPLSATGKVYDIDQTTGRVITR